MTNNIAPPSSLRTTHLHRLLDRVSRRLSRHILKIKKKLGINIEYPYTAFSIILPADHLLPVYQQYHKLYDRFLPHLVKYIEPNSTVIDVGANCGDTLAAMYESNKSLTYICVESDDTFFDLLQRNALRINKLDKDVSIYAIKALVGINVTDVTLSGSGGTKYAVIHEKIQDNTKTLLSQTLDNLVSHIRANNIRLLKSDVDGFDYDVIDSAESIIKSQSPILFFECQFDYYKQKTGYEKTIAELQINGYKNWVIFDNFGELVLQTEDIGLVFQLLNYVWRQNSNRSTRTIFYYDILAATKKDDALLAKVISDYI